MFDKTLDNFLNDKVTNFSEIEKEAWKQDITKWKNLDNLAWIAIWVSSPEDIKELSYWKILISETINYRTQKPERWGLFCEQIFGPRKNYECACGKYKRIRYKGIVCERCWVEVTKATVRRQRMAHIDLYAPVAHIWYMKSVPSRIGLFLNLPVKKLEQVVYFASYIVTDIDEEARTEALKNLEERYKVTKAEMQKEAQREINNIKLQKESGEIKEKSFKEKESLVFKTLDDFELEYNEMKDWLKGLVIWNVLWELEYRNLSENFSHVFKWGTWAEHIRTLLERIDLEQFIIDQQVALSKSTKTNRKKILQKIKLATNLAKSGQRPEWFILTALPVIPPDLRPMIQLDGWRFASSDLNDLYRRVINRNNRLRKLIELWAPEVILKNEKRMLQESVDMLITGSTRTNRSWFVTANKKELKSLTDVLKGKQGRFRQNLLGKRVDYSGRSVIIVGPELRIDECWIPKKMALILFKPFVIGRLIEDGLVYNVKHAEKFIDEGGKEVWDALDDIIRDKYVLLNRAPTLHRLSIQAFKPVLVDWKAIQLHPLTCPAFNADFDWDQMAVHLPITDEAQKEARELMTTSKNLLAPSSWDPIVTPSQDMILGSYYLTVLDVEDKKGEWLYFDSIIDAEQAYDAEAIGYRTPIKVRIEGELIETNYWRLLFNEIIPDELGYQNTVFNKWALKKILARSFEELWPEITAQFVDEIMRLGYKYVTKSGLTISKDDMVTPKEKVELMADWEEKVKFIQKQRWLGFLTEDEKYNQSIAIWAQVKKSIEKELKKEFDYKNHLFNFVDSWARWNWWNLTQLCWMKGLVASPSGKTIELPIKSTLKEGFSTLEYFIATHGWRKWKSDTALKTAQSGYLTRRLVDSSQNIIVRADDCKTVHYKEVDRNDKTGGNFSESFEDKIYGRTLATDLLDNDGKKVADALSVIDKPLFNKIQDLQINIVNVRSILTCEAEGWACKKCYGLDLWLNKEVEIGTPVWVIAAQSIWEPGTQLTMRTFHSWWVAKEGWDMTQGLARIEELFEARIPHKSLAEISDIEWEVSIEHTDSEVIVTVVAKELKEEEYYFESSFETKLKVGQEVKAKQILTRDTESKKKVTSLFAWIVDLIEENRIVIKDREPRVMQYALPFGKDILVSTGDFVKAWTKLTEWNIDLHKLTQVAWIIESQKYIVEEIKSIYSSQWQTVNSKHIELIIRQMFSRVRILEKWDSNFFPWDIIDVIAYDRENRGLIEEGKKQAIGERLLLWITKISLHTDSWLSAASFQETVRVLVESSISGKIDKLAELKENVIIGRLIPAWKQYRKNMWLEVDECDCKEEYFDSRSDNIDVSEAHLQDVLKEMVDESDF